MQKAKKYDWKDSNMALFGSDTEKKVKKESAESEPAWRGSGQEVGLRIWRIVKFKVEDWPKEDYGTFYNGDSYIVLNTYKKPDSDALLYDVHFWIGKYSTQDEYGTAAYKTVELDTLLDDKPIQHREVMGHESTLFKSYFPTLELLKGGADTGFRRVLPEAYTPRLLHVQKDQTKKIRVTEKSAKKQNVTDDDVFILDLGQKIYQYNGAKCSHDEKFKAAQYIAQLKSSRGKVQVETLEAENVSKNHPFFENLKDGGSKSAKPVNRGPNKLFRVSDADGSLDMEEVKQGTIELSDLESKDVFVIDLWNEAFVWVGSGASIDERKNGLSYGSNYLNKTEHPWASLSVVAEGNQEGIERLTQALAA